MISAHILTTVMYMRGKFFLVLLLILAVLCLTSCVKSIECPADELKMFSWSGKSDNGTEISLYFTDTRGYLDMDQDDGLLRLGGLCMITDDSLLIFDEQSGMNYSFGYELYGDRVELKHNGSIMTLNKRESE